ncbi:MAG: tetratricopeptide repeat protein [Candidatus Sericytochromatia bacterium]
MKSMKITLLAAALILAGTLQARAEDCKLRMQQLQQLYNQGSDQLQAVGLELMRSCSKSEDLYLFLAIDRFNRGDDKGALTTLELGLENLPDNPRLLASQGVVLNKLGRLDEALASLNRAIALDPKSGDAYTQRGGLYISLEQLDKAKADLEKGIAMGSGSSITHAHLAYVLLQQQAWEQALAQTNLAIALNPGNGRAYRFRSLAYKGLGLCELARQNLFKSCEMEGNGACTDICAPQKSDTLDAAYEAYGKGHELVRGRDYAAALPLLDRAIELFDRDPGFFIDRSVARSKLGQEPAALADIEQAIRLDPGSKVAYYNLGKHYHDTNAFAQAYAAYTQALIRDPKYLSAWQNRALVLGELGRFDEGIADMDQALQLVAGEAEAEGEMYEIRGYIHFQANQQELALVDFDAALARIPDFAMVFDDKARVYQKLGQCELAKKHFARACELGFKAACNQACK